MICPQCKANIDDRSSFCNRCGAKQEPQKSKSQEQDRYAPREYGPQQSQQHASQQPQPQGIDLSGLNDKKWLVFSIACFGWALVRGIPAIIGLLRVLPSITMLPWGSWHGWFAIISALFAVGLHVALPLILGGVFLRKHKDEERKN